ncbi:MAG: hypothetical protein AAAB35_29810 [Phyllobacterium sp.]|uniref:hypothetical protein n=1 Tax=Phyllobacterium sp. TaxID=1871046 RepID=UPI0030F19784
MEAIEQAIRNALAKSDAKNPAIRQKIYESAWGAHERSLAANGALDENQREDRREMLKAAITRIEDEVQATGGITPPPAPEPVAEPSEPMFAPGPPKSRGTDARIEPSIDIGPPEVEAPVLVDDDSKADNYRPGKARRKLRRDGERRKASGFSKALIILALLAVALGLFWVVASGIIKPKPGMAPSNTTGPAATESSQEPTKEGQLSATGNWIEVFNPTDMSQVALEGRATATIGGDQLEKFVRIQSPTETDTISFKVGQGVLDQLAGKTAVFDIIAKAEDGKSSQIAVSCDFGNLGDCGRKRFDISDASKEYLVQVQFPEGNAPAEGGVIKINSDVTQSGKSVNIIAIRAQVAN